MAATITLAQDTYDGVERFRRMVWWSVVGLVYGAGIFMVASILFAESDTSARVLGVLGAVAGSLSAARLLERRFDEPAALNEEEPFSAPSGLLAAAVFGAVATPVAAVLGTGEPTWSIIPGVVLAGVAVWIPRRYRMSALTAAPLFLLLLVASARLVSGEAWAWGDDVVNAVVVAALAGAIVSTMWSWDVVLRLNRARQLEADLAVADERLRFAADLHDVQGHHLQVIALESELASRLAVSDPAAAGPHMERVHEQARSALAETRDLVHGYRRTSLREELSNAVRVLEAAGIDGRLERGTEETADRLPQDLRHVLGLVVRETTTNAIRHSRAGRAHLALAIDAGAVTLLVSNDGVVDSGDAPGSGLIALEERIGALGGTLRWGREGDRFEVRAVVPAKEPQ